MVSKFHEMIYFLTVTVTVTAIVIIIFFSFMLFLLIFYSIFLLSARDVVGGLVVVGVVVMVWFSFCPFLKGIKRILLKVLLRLAWLVETVKFI